MWPHRDLLGYGHDHRPCPRVSQPLRRLRYNRVFRRGKGQPSVEDSPASEASVDLRTKLRISKDGPPGHVPGARKCSSEVTHTRADTRFSVSRVMTAGSCAAGHGIDAPLRFLDFDDLLGAITPQRPEVRRIPLAQPFPSWLRSVSFSQFGSTVSRTECRRSRRGAEQRRGRAPTRRQVTGTLAQPSETRTRQYRRNARDRLDPAGR
jgi:hypothetical protein